MLSLSGTLVLASGILGATFAAISYGLATRGNRIAFQCGRIGARASLGMTLLAAALLVYAFAARRYDITYVYTYSVSELLLRYRIAEMWRANPARFWSGRGRVS